MNATMPLSNLNHARLVDETPPNWTPDRRFIDLKIPRESTASSSSDAPQERKLLDSESLERAVSHLNKIK